MCTCTCACITHSVCQSVSTCYMYFILKNFSSPALIFVTHWAFFIVIFFQYFGTGAGCLVIWKIWVQSEISPENFLKHSFQSNNHLIQENFNKAKWKNLCSMHPLIASGVMKMTTAVNIAGSGLSCTHFHMIFNRNGEDGLFE